VKFIGQASKTSFFYKKNQNDLPNWQLFYRLKCNSTEIQLNNYLKKKNKLINPVAIIAKQQTAGFGQYQRDWSSPMGGIWLSAAYPIYSSKFLSEIFSLSISCKLCEIFYHDSLHLQLKWPNDILYGSKKLIGLLPKIVTRGDQVLYARIGIGFNLNNRTPEEGISLSEILNKRNLSENYWTSRILAGISEAIMFNHEKEKVISKANALLNKRYLPSGYTNNSCHIKDIDLNGNLRLVCGNQIKIIRI